VIAMLWSIVLTALCLSAASLTLTRVLARGPSLAGRARRPRRQV
jgi:hypothetical protein